MFLICTEFVFKTES